MPGARVGVSDNTIAAFEVAYRLNDRWTTRLAAGIPPTTTLSAQGSLKGFVPPLTGTLGRATYGPAVWSLTYRPFDIERVRPYVGVGLNYTLVSNADDGDVQNLKVKSAWGTALEAGLDVPLDAHWSLFVDVRKVFVKTTATGTVPALGGPSAKAYVTLNPLITHVGVGYRF
jgi:outer membrane protein